MRKKVVLDTSVILHEVSCFHSFKNSDIYIPFSVIEEIDQFKRDMGEKGRNARQFSRYIDILREGGSLTQGVDLEDSASRLFISRDFDLNHLPKSMDSQRPDHRILALALSLKKDFKDVEVITKDINLRIKADILNIKARDYDQDRRVHFGDLYTGVRRISISLEQFEQFQSQGFIHYEGNSCYPNQYFVMESQKASFAGRYEDRKIVSLMKCEKPIWGIRPRNLEQNMALDSLLNDKISFVSLMGKAGTGKTLLAMAVGLQKTLEENLYQRLVVSRPVFPMGRDIGYLPGDISQKLHPWMQPIYDSMEFLMNFGKNSVHLTRDMINQGAVHIEPLAYIRGRSLPRQFLIVDEAQNLTPHEVKTIVTRAGSDTKVVLTGDCYQIDNPYVDSSSNGLCFSIEKFKGEVLCSHVTLNQGERSELAELAANLL